MSEVTHWPIDTKLDTKFVNRLAQKESYNKHYYRPNSYLHKWWARRCGTTFRAILKQLVEEESKRDFYTAGGLEGKRILDPMMGGGTTLHEAIRMGASVIGTDIDPIPVVQARASLSHVPLTELESAFAILNAHLQEKLGTLFTTCCPFCDTIVQLRHTLYAREEADHLLVDALILKHNTDGSIVHICPDTGDIYQDDTVISNSVRQLPPIRGRDRRRPRTQAVSEKPYYQRLVPIAIAGRCPIHGTFLTAPQLDDLAKLDEANRLRAMMPYEEAQFLVHEDPKSTALLARGVTHYLDLFSSRQLLYLLAAQNFIQTLPEIVRLNFGLLISTSTEFNSLLCGYKGGNRQQGGAIRHAFARHGYTFPTTVVENNPIYAEQRNSGSLPTLFHNRILRARQWATAPVERKITQRSTKKITIKGEFDGGEEVDALLDLSKPNQFWVRQQSAVSLSLPTNSIDFVVTDPPYFDSIQYSDLAAYFRVWLNQLLPDAANWSVDLNETAVEQRANGQDQYVTILSQIFRECARVLKDNGRFIFTFHHWKPEAWAGLTIALKQANMRLVNRYVVQSESPLSVHINKQRALLHDVVFVLAHQDSDAPKTAWQMPEEISTADSETFCELCGTAVGAMLDGVEVAEIRERWERICVDTVSLNKSQQAP